VERKSDFFALKSPKPNTQNPNNAMAMAWPKKTPWLGAPPSRTGGPTALQLYACLNPAEHVRATPIIVVLSPSLRARIGCFRSNAVTKCASLIGDGVFRAWAFFFQSEKALGRRRGGLAHFVAAALPNISIRGLKLGDMTTLTDVARRWLTAFRHA